MYIYILLDTIVNSYLRSLSSQQQTTIQKTDLPGGGLWDLRLGDHILPPRPWRTWTLRPHQGSIGEVRWILMICVRLVNI